MRRHLAAVTDLVVVRIDLEHVLMERVRIEHLTGSGIHESEQRVARNVRVSGEDDPLNDRIFDHAIGDRYAVRPLPDQRWYLVGKVAEVVDRGKVFANRLLVERLSDFGLNDRHDFVGRDVDVPRDRHGHDDRSVDGGSLHGRRGRRCAGAGCATVFTGARAPTSIVSIVSVARRLRIQRRREHIDRSILNGLTDAASAPRGFGGNARAEPHVSHALERALWQRREVRPPPRRSWHDSRSWVAPTTRISEARTRNRFAR